MAEKDHPSAPPPPSYHTGPAQPVMAQPVSTTTAVVISGGGKPGVAPQNVRDWSTGLCGCCTDCSSCCFAFFCWYCFLCTLSSEMGEDCCGPWFCGWPFLAAMRVKARTMYGIRGTICGDMWMVICCQQCAMCQIAREMKIMNGHQVAPVTVTNVQTR